MKKRKTKMSLMDWLNRGTKLTGHSIAEGHKYYVYYLRYPLHKKFGDRAGEVFYVGKGTRQRVAQHEAETRRLFNGGRDMYLKHKHKVIIQIWKGGFDVVQEIVYRTDSEDEAYQVESREIDRIGLAHLTNATLGRRPTNGRRRRRAS